jgi:prepilin-type N-terminal cleavage/methylation domain-containing protein
MPPRIRQPRPAGFAFRRGFTLIEASITMVIVGVGCLGMLKLMAAGTMANADSAELTTAMMLANNVREATQTGTNFSFTSPSSPTHWGRESGETANTPSTWDDLDDWDGAKITPAVDARNQPMTQYANWEQDVTIESMDPDRIWSTMGHGTLPPDQRPVNRVTVTILHNSNAVCTVQWYVAYAP